MSWQPWRKRYTIGVATPKGSGSHTLLPRTGSSPVVRILHAQDLRMFFLGYALPIR